MELRVYSVFTSASSWQSSANAFGYIFNQDDGMFCISY